MKLWRRGHTATLQHPELSTPPDPQRLQVMLLVAVAVVLLAYIVRVRPMQSEMEEILLSFESESASASEPSVEPSQAAYTSNPQKAVADFYARMEQMMQTVGISVESRQARLETDPRYPAATLIYECRCRMRWPELLTFLSAVRQDRPRIRITRMTVRRLDPGPERQMVEIFFEARALALEFSGV